MVTDGPELTDLDETTTAVVRDVVPMTGLAAFFDRSFSAIPAALAAQGVEPTGPAFARYRSIADGQADLEVGFPVATPIEPANGVEVGSIPGGRVARLVHHGAYDQLGDSWERLRAWMADNGHVPGSWFVEIYTTQPSPEMDPADLRTELLRPLA